MLTAAAACVLLATGCCSLAGAAALTASAGLAAAAATATAAALAASAAKLACLCLSYSLARSPLRLPGSADIEVSNVSSDTLEKHNFSIDSVAGGC